MRAPGFLLRIEKPTRDDTMRILKIKMTVIRMNFEILPILLYPVKYDVQNVAVAVCLSRKERSPFTGEVFSGTEFLQSVG